MTRQQLQKKIGKIRMGLTAVGEPYTLSQMPDEQKAILSAVDEYVAWVVGEDEADEPDYVETIGSQEGFRNELRADQRQRAGIK